MTQAEAAQRNRAMELLLAGGLDLGAAARLTQAPRAVMWGNATPNSALALMLGAQMAGRLPEVDDDEG